MTQKDLKNKLLELKLCVNNKYLSKYVKLIINNKTNIKQRGYDLHHIVPRYYYKNISKELDNTEDNLVYLSRADHILAHLYLCFCSYNDKYKGSNSTAVIRFLGQHKANGITYDLEDFIINHKEEINQISKINSEMQSKRQTGTTQNISDKERERRRNLSKSLRQNLGRTRIYYNNEYKLVKEIELEKLLKLGAVIKGKPHTKESNEKNRKAHLGKPLPHTKEWNNNIGRSNKGKKLSEECKDKISASLKGNTIKCGHIRGKIAINNGKTYKYVLEEEFIDIYELQGWIRGTGNKNSCKNKGLIRINNENGAKYVTLEDWETKYSKEGWHRGYDWKKY